MQSEDVYIDKLVRITLIVAIGAWTFQLLYPLLGILAWGLILAVVLYPFYFWLTKHLGNREVVSATIITFFVLLLVTGIAVFITNDIAYSIRNFTARIHSGEQILPGPPEMIQHWPLIGEQLHQSWSSASANLAEELTRYSNPLLNAGKYALTKLVSTGKDFFLFIVSILFSGFFLVKADDFMLVLRKFAKRVANERGINMINMIRDTLQNVSRGVIGISILQTFIFGVLLLIASVPGVTFLSLLALIFSIVQVGLFIIIIPIIIWLFLAKSFGLALVVSIFLILDALLDTFLKPIVLARGLPTPMMIIFIGVIGGILVYGLIGIFIGPVVLAMAYDLMHQWINTGTKQA